MLKGIFFLAVISIFFFSTGRSQEQFVTRKNDFIIKHSPSSYFDQDLPTQEMGVTYFISSALAFQMKFGQKVSFDNSPYQFNGYRVLAEVQWFRRKNFYFALEGAYSQNPSENVLRYYKDGDNNNLVGDRYTATTYKKWVVLKSGFMFVKKRTVINIYWGIGPKFIRRSFRDFEFNSGKDMLASEGDDFTPIDFDPFGENASLSHSEFKLKFCTGVDFAYKLHIGKK